MRRHETRQDGPGSRNDSAKGSGRVIRLAHLVSALNRTWGDAVGNGAPDAFCHVTALQSRMPSAQAAVNKPISGAHLHYEIAINLVRYAMELKALWIVVMH